MKVYDKCNELAREIKESNEYKELFAELLEVEDD